MMNRNRNSDMRIIFMGTQFAVPSLKALIDNKYDVVCAVTQRTDRRAGLQGCASLSRNTPCREVS